MGLIGIKTNIGVADAINAQQGGLNFSLVTYKLGNGFGYTPLVTDTDIRGTLQISGNITDCVQLNQTQLRFLVQLPTTMGNFKFGEIGLYSASGVCYYLGAWDALVDKTADNGSVAGNTISIQMPIDFSVSGANVKINTFTTNVAKLGEVSNFDALLPAINAITNSYIVGMGSQNDRTVAYAALGNNLWRFSNYMRTGTGLVVSQKSSNAITISSVNLITIVDSGDIIFQVTSGAAKGLVRSITTWTSGGGNTTLNFANSMPNLAPGDQVEIHTNLNAWTKAQLLAEAGSYVPISQVGVANGVATLDANSKVTSGQLPVSTTMQTGVIQLATQAIMNAGADFSQAATPGTVKTFTDATYIAQTRVGAVGGLAMLDANRLLVTSQIPPQAIQRPTRVNSQAAMLALSANLGDTAIRSDTSETYMLGGSDPTNLGNWYLLPNKVTSVNGQGGGVTITADNISAVPTNRFIQGAGLALIGVDTNTADQNPQALSANKIVYVPAASNAEVNAATISNKAVVPSSLVDLVTSLNNKVPTNRGLSVAGPLMIDNTFNTTMDFSTTRTLNLNVASTSEALAGLINNKVLTPASLGGLGRLFSTNGYQVLLGGLILQWGVSYTNDDNTTISMPTTFPNTGLVVVASQNSRGQKGYQNNTQAWFINSSQIGITNWEHSLIGCYWIAIGF